MNPSSDFNHWDAPGILEPAQTLSFEDVAPLLQQITPGKVHFVDNIESSGDFTPDNQDIICGRDKQAFNHVGNKRFRVLIARSRETYQNAKTREAKSKITDDIIDTILESGRFLKYDYVTKLWCVVTRDYAHEKVSHALRSAKDPRKKKPRKKRMVHKTYTKEEDETFNFLFVEQQKIFQELLHDGDGKPAEEFAIDFSVIDEIGSNPTIKV